MIFVTVYWPLTTTGAFETVVQPVGSERSLVNCKVSPALLVGHAKMIALGVGPPSPAVLTVAASTGGELEITGGGADTNVGEKTRELSPAVPSLKSIAPT